MAYPNSKILNIVIPQTSASLAGGTEAPFVETIISGSKLILQTDSAGFLIGSSDLNVNNITASNISASGFISASNLRVETSVVDGGSLTVLGNTILGDTSADSTQITGAASISGSLSVVGSSTLQNTFITNLTASNISASGFITASSIYDTGTLTVLGNSTLSNVFATNITASNISASNKMVASEITASSELFVGTGNAYRQYTEASTTQNISRLYVSGSVSVLSKYATLNLATSASGTDAQSSILFSRLADVDFGSGPETILQPRWQIGTESGSNDLRMFAYYVSNDPDNIAQGSKGQNIVAGARVVMKQNGYFGIGNFYNYGLGGGAKTTYQSVLPGYNVTENTVPYYGPDALLTLLPMDSGSVGTAASKEFNRNILNIMSYDTSSIMFISGSDGYVLLGKNTTDGINRLQVSGNVSASAYTGSSAKFTNLVATNITASNISASGVITSSGLYIMNPSIGVIGSADAAFDLLKTGVQTLNFALDGTAIVMGSTTGYTLIQNQLIAPNISSSANIIGSNITASNISASGQIITNTLSVTGNTTLTNTFATNLTASNISASNSLTASALYVENNLQVNGNTILGNATTDANTSSGSFKIINTNNPTTYTDTTAALQVDGGARISKDTYISGSLNVAGDLTIFGSSSVVYISSSTVIINDNIIQLNAFAPYERYAGFEVYDSGSNERSASLLWDGFNDNWITVDQNNSSSNMIIGPTASFGSAIPSLTVNKIPKAYDVNGIVNSLLSDDGTTLAYTGTTISSSKLLATTGSITYITGALVTYVTGSFTTLTIATGSSPGAGAVPSTPTSAGMPGQINVDNNFIYVYTNNIWKRVPISNWSA